MKTGNKKKYKEDPPIALFGSPDSYYEIEYKCNKGNCIFLEKHDAFLFN